MIRSDRAQTEFMKRQSTETLDDWSEFVFPSRFSTTARNRRKQKKKKKTVLHLRLADGPKIKKWNSNKNEQLIDFSSKTNRPGIRHGFTKPIYLFRKPTIEKKSHRYAIPRVAVCSERTSAAREKNANRRLEHSCVFCVRFSLFRGETFFFFAWACNDYSVPVKNAFDFSKQRRERCNKHNTVPISGTSCDVKRYGRVESNIQHSPKYQCHNIVICIFNFYKTTCLF